LDEQADFLAALRRIVGAARVHTTDQKTRRFRMGFRHEGGHALAAVQPRSLLELWRVLSVCVSARKIVIPQAANTGLTGGSTPAPEGYDRDAVIVNMMHIGGVRIIDHGRQVICLPGATLHQLERALKPLGREPHSVIGSSCLGASVIGGICNNSGGSLIRRGPAYTELALFARVSDRGDLQLINHLGIRLGEDPEDILARLERGEFAEGDIEYPVHQQASDRDYEQRIRQVDSERPTRFNADPRRLFEASGSAGHVIVFAVRLDTFPSDQQTRVFYIGTNDPGELTMIRRHMLSRFQNLPVAGEYLHRDAFNLAQTYGKDTFLAVRHLGTDRLPHFFRLRSAFDQWAKQMGFGAAALSDRLLQLVASLMPQHLPRRMREYRDRFEHHLLLKMANSGVSEAESYLRSLFPSASGDMFICTAEEGAKAFLHRFAAAGAAIRYRALHARQVQDLVALDVALKASDRNWLEKLPPPLSEQIRGTFYYGHFFCHVFHQDYLVKKGCDPAAVKRALLQILDQRGAEYPAEHNVGHQYRAKQEMIDFYRELDPSNSLNPGVGQTSRKENWAG